MLEISEDLGMGRTKLVFHALGKILDESDKLNKYKRGGEIVYLQCFRKTCGIKSGPGKEQESIELRDSNTSDNSIETELIEERRTLGGIGGT